MTFQFAGIGSGIDSASIINQLMQIERMPQDRLNVSRQSFLSMQTAWQAIATKLATLKTAADALSTVDKARSNAATSSNTSLLTATASATAATGSLSLTVTQLATAQQLASASFSSSSAIVGAGTFNMTTGSVTGLSNVGIADSATKHTLVVTSGSATATTTGTTAAGLTFQGNQRSETFTINGVATTITLNASYASAAALASDIQTKIGTGVTVTANSSGALVFTTTKEGSAASIGISGSATSVLGLTAGTVTGLDAQGTIDGTAVTIPPAPTGTTTSTLNGMLTVTAGTHVGTGTVTVAAARTTSSTATLADLAAAINAAGGPASAAIVAPSATGGSVQLILSASQTGTANSMSIATSGLAGFSGTNAGFTTLQTAKDAQVSLGTGMTVTRSTNTISDLMPGVTINLVKADPTTAVTVSVAPSADDLTTKVKALVDALNALRTEVNTDTAYDVAAKKGGPLVGEWTASSLVDSLRSAMTGTLGTGVTKTLSQLGVSADRDGVYSVDESKLRTAVASDPNGVASLIAGAAANVSTFVTNATATTGSVTSSANNAGSRAADLQKQIDAWDLRLAIIHDRYQAQFTALDVAMSKLNAQQSWLTGQLGGLSSSSQK